MPKQKIKSRLPSLKERHSPGGYNWNGPGTSVEERLSLNYDGKVGTETYWLPVNKLDYEAFKHDLSYYSPVNADNIEADRLYVQNTKAGFSKALIYAQLLSRQVEDTPALDIMKDVGSLAAMGKAAARIISTPIKKGGGSIMGWFLNPKGGVAPPIIKKFAKDYLNIRGSIRGPRKSKVAKALSAAGLIYGLGPKKTTESLISKLTLKGAKPTEGFKERHDEVVAKYDAYLESVGFFNAAGDFILYDKPKNSSQTLYEEFFVKYAEFVKWSDSKFEHLRPGVILPELNEKKKNILLYTDEKKDMSSKDVIAEIKGAPSPFDSLGQLATKTRPSPAPKPPPKVKVKGEGTETSPSPTPKPPRR